MTATVRGIQSTWEGERDDEGHRTFFVEHKVECSSASDGPQIVMACSGLPQIGDAWTFGNDSDTWALCYPFMRVSLHEERKGEKGTWWLVRQKFSTRPLNRCQDTEIGSPLLEPMKISGTFVKYTKEANRDRNGALIQSSSHEMFRGPQVEFDANRPSVRVEQNVSSLELETLAEMVDTVNDATLWGLAARKVKLSNISWERLLYGTCSIYFKRVFDFDIDFNTFDRDIVDEGTKALNGDWDRDQNSATCGDWKLNTGPVGCPKNPDKNNPQDFVRYKDVAGEIARVILDGNGLPADSTIFAGTGTGTSASGPAHLFTWEYYPQKNFLLLGIPTDLVTLGTA